MDRKQLVIVVMIITSISNIIKAQQNNVIYKKYSVIIPDEYQGKGKSYPLIVCLQNQATDSLFQQFAKYTQSIILQFDNRPDTNLQLDSIKAIIQKTIHEYAVLRDKIYLLGVNQNIANTTVIYETLKYYFAATAFITSNQNTYTLLKDSLKLNSSVQLFFFYAIDYNSLDTVQKLFLKNYSWGFEVEKISNDAIMLNFQKSSDQEKKNQVSFSYGQWNFNNSAKSDEISLIDIPKNMNALNLAYSRFLSEHLSLKLNLGLLVKKIRPPQPDLFSVINGSNIEVEGGGILMMPISIGMEYLYLKQRFRPYSGFSIGYVPAKYKYVEASGNLSNGINRSEIEFNSNAPFFELSSGFVYRTGKNILMGLNGGYFQSKKFRENIGGYTAYNGYKISFSFAFVF